MSCSEFGFTPGSTVCIPSYQGEFERDQIRYVSEDTSSLLISACDASRDDEALAGLAVF
jgi:hypothetical protein